MTPNSKLTALVLSYYYPPDNTSGVFRTLYFFNHIARRKQWQINILTLDSRSYLTGQNQDEKLNRQIDPLVKVFRSRSIHPRELVIRLKNSLKSEKGGIDNAVMENQHVQEVGNKKKNLWRRCKDIITEDLLGFPDDKIGWLPFSFGEACKIIKEKKVDLIYSTGSPWTSHLLAYILKKKTGLPLVLDYRDPWFGNPYETSNHSVLYKKVSLFLEKTIIAKADKVICNTERLKLFYMETFGSENKFEVITNGYELLIDENRGNKRKRDEFVIVHAGSLYGGRNPDNFLQAIVNISKQSIPVRLRVILVGAGDEIKEQIIEKYGQEIVQEIISVTPRVSHSECMSYLVSADLLLLFQQGTKLQVPRKLYEYIGMRKPIFGICEDGETRDIIIENKLGVSVKDDVNEIENALAEMLNGDSGCDASVKMFKQFNNKILASKLEKLFDSLVNERKR